MEYIHICVLNQCENWECVNIVMSIYCFNKCGIALEEFIHIYHLPFGNHLLGNFFSIFFIGTKGLSTFSIIYIIDEGVHKSGLIFNSNLKGVC
jgi:hypothetical protein